MLIDLPDDVREELEDERFKTRKHYSRSTYALDCHGPFCRKAESDRGRLRSKERASSKGRAYVPNRKIRKTAEDERLEPLISAYLKDRLWFAKKSA